MFDVQTALLLTAISTVLSTASLVGSGLCIRAVRAYTAPAREVVELQLQVADLEYQNASLTSSIKRLNARVGMREAREKKAQAEPDDDEQSPASAETAMLPGETPESWKKRMRLALAQRRMNG